METKAKAMQLTTHSGGPSKQEEIKMLLAKMAIRRQAKMGELEFAVFSDDLMPYETRDVKAALESLSSKPRTEGETAFPDIATIIWAVRRVIGERGDRRAIDAENERIAHFRAHPEMYETPAEVVEMAKKINDRFGMERPKVIDTTPVMMNCPHCSQELPVGPNIRFWTPEELRAYADVLERNQAIAAANREAHRIALEIAQAMLTEEVA